MFASKTLGTSISANTTFEGVPRSKLVAIFNEVSAKPVKQFRDHATAVKRIHEALAERTAADRAAAAAKPAKAPKAPKEPKAPKTPKAPKAKKEGAVAGRPLDLNYPVGSPECPVVKPPRGSSARAKCVELLAQKGGTNLEEVMKVTGWNRQQAIPGVRLVHHKCGYGIKHDLGSGTLSLVRA